ncbi:MAG: YfhO family protein [Ruminococcus sp.]|nr:YfhO family protein [Ruminococcus sp.]
MAKTKAVSSKPENALPAPSEYVKYRPLYYVAAFLIPALLTFIAYALFGVYPFGERSVLTLDLNGQYVYYFEAIRDAFWGDRTALYSWQRNLSGGFQGVIGYYLASPFTLIVILLPRKMIVESLMIMQLCKVGACGVTFSVFAQKSKGVRPLQSVIFSTMYALMAFVAIQLIDPMWIDGPIFLPLIILGVEYLIDDGRKINYIIPLAIMFIANFYIGFMVAIFVAIYFTYYLFFGAKTKFKGVPDYAKVIGRMVLATGVGLMCSYIMIVPVYNALALGKFDFSTPDYSFRTMFNPLELIPCLLPDQYYSVNVDEGTRMYGRPEIYCGVLTFALVPLYYLNSKIKINRKIGQSFMLVIMYLSMWIKPINMMWHGGQDPNWLPYRYSFIVSFILVAMAAEVFGHLDGYNLSFKHCASIFAAVTVLIILFEAKMPSFNYNENKYKYVATTPYSTQETIAGESVKHIWLGTLVFGVILMAIYLTFVYLYSNARKKQQRTIISICMAAFVFFEAGYNCFDTILKIDKEVYYSSKKSYSVIMDAPNVMENLKNIDDGFYRAEKTFFRTVNDNQAYGLKGISHSSSVMNTRAIRFIETLGYTTKSYETRYDGNTPVADSLLGIKYVLDDPSKHSSSNGKSLLSPYYNKISSMNYMAQDDVPSTLDVYENPDALPIGFMADDDILKLSFLGNDNPFNSMNNFLSSMTGNTPDYSALVPKAYFRRVNIDPTTDVELNECWESDYNGQHCYNANAGAADPNARVHITTEDDSCLYMFLKSDNPKKFNLWVSSTKDENGNFCDFQGFGQYFEGYDYSIVNLGSYPAGTELEIRMTIVQSDKTGNNEYIMVKDFQFYHFDYDAFHEDINSLKANPWNLDLDKTTDDHLIGDVDAQEGQVFYTSIPYEPGWTIKVDGNTVDELFFNDTSSGTSIMKNDKLDSADTGEVVILNALIGLKLPAGHHTVEMSYSPPGFKMGIVLMILGIAVMVFFYMNDRKTNPVMIAERRARERRKQGLPPEVSVGEQIEAAKPKVQIIKSKGAVAETELTPAKENKPYEEDAEEESSSAEESAEETASDEAEEEKTPAAEDEAPAEVKKPANQPKPNNGNNNKPRNGGKKKKKK